MTDAVTYKLDAWGNRIERGQTGTTPSTQRYVVDGWDTAKPAAVGTEGFEAVMDLDGGNAVTSRRVFGAGFDDAVARQDAGGAVTWYAADAQGTVRQVLDNSGNTVGSQAFTGFGAVTATSGTGLDRYAYTGTVTDPLTGLVGDDARQYDPQLGKWTSDDPIGFAGGDYNVSRAVGNKGTTGRDPSGLWDHKKFGEIVRSMAQKDPEKADLLAWMNGMGVNAVSGTQSNSVAFATWGEGADRRKLTIFSGLSEQEAAEAYFNSGQQLGDDAFGVFPEFVFDARDNLDVRSFHFEFRGCSGEQQLRALSGDFKRWLRKDGRAGEDLARQVEMLEAFPGMVARSLNSANFSIDWKEVGLFLEGASYIAEMAEGVALLLTPEPTMLTKVGGLALIYHGWDNWDTLCRSVQTGQQQKTRTEMIVSDSMQACGYGKFESDSGGGLVNTYMTLPLGMVARPKASGGTFTTNPRPTTSGAKCAAPATGGPEFARGFHPRSTPLDIVTRDALPEMRFENLTTRAQRIVKRADTVDEIALGPGGIPTSTLREASMYLNRELAVVQGTDGNLRLLIGTENGVLRRQFRPGDQTLIHTHPTRAIPHQDHFFTDLDFKFRHGDTTVEAVLDWEGRITFFNHERIGLQDPGGIFNHTGKKVIGNPK